ncbi:hypothetical protein ABIH81_05080 [Micromonospora sp. HUAS YX12]|uniref:Uncharacterized protein n=1 Tax=Micromonospora sp. HUAS YX12 TaxID=3156396 RepID=A0AAU7R3L9_9ACTN
MTALPGRRPTAVSSPVAGRPADEDLRTLFGQSIAVFAALAGPTHVVEAANPAFINVRSVFIANEELGGLAAYLNR